MAKNIFVYTLISVLISGTMIYYMFARWIKSWRDLPLKISLILHSVNTYCLISVLCTISLTAMDVTDTVPKRVAPHRKLIFVGPDRDPINLNNMGNFPVLTKKLIDAGWRNVTRQRIYGYDDELFSLKEKKTAWVLENIRKGFQGNGVYNTDVFEYYPMCANQKEKLTLEDLWSILYYTYSWQEAYPYPIRIALVRYLVEKEQIQIPLLPQGEHWQKAKHSTFKTLANSFSSVRVYADGSVIWSKPTSALSYIENTVVLEPLYTRYSFECAELSPTALQAYYNNKGIRNVSVDKWDILSIDLLDGTRLRRTHAMNSWALHWNDSLPAIPPIVSTTI